MRRMPKTHPLFWPCVVSIAALLYCAGLPVIVVLKGEEYRRKKKKKERDLEKRVGELRSTTMASKPRRPYPRLAAIEKETNKILTIETGQTNVERVAMRSVTIETRKTGEGLSKCHAQQQSLLFTLPAELRNLIFEYATVPWLDAEHLYPKTEFYYRPGHEGRYVTSTALLATCRRAWLEANHLPMQNTEHCFWFRGPGRRPQYLDDIFADEANRLTHFLQKMTPNNRNNLRGIRLFAQTAWLETHLLYKLRSILGYSMANVCPEIFTITIKHTDWPYWARDASPELREDKWLHMLLSWPAPPRLREIRLELETLESRMDGLRSIVDRISRGFGCVERSNHSGPGPNCMELQQPAADWTWSGPANLGQQQHAIYSDLEKLDYRVVTLVWKLHAPATQDAGTKHVLKPDIRFAIENLRHSKSASRGAGGHEASELAAQQCIQRWKQEGSLLKFAPALN